MFKSIFLYFNGKIDLKIFDDRNKKIHNFKLGNKSKYSKILIPKNVWYGFKGLKQIILLLIHSPFS